MDAFPLTLIASVPNCISPHRYVLSPHTDSHPFMIVTPSHLTRTDTCPLAQTHAHSHRHMPTRTDTWMPTCPDTWMPTCTDTWMPTCTDTWMPTPSSSPLLPAHLAWVPLISPEQTHAHLHG